MEIDLSKIVIRKVEDADISVMIEHRINYLSGLQGSRDNYYKQSLKKELEEYFRTAIKDGSFFALMALYEGIAVAFGGIIIKKVPGDFNKTTYLEGDILNMYTIPEARRNGISSLILAELLNQSKRIGISKIALHTSKDGEKMYRKFGFCEPVYPVLELIV